VGTVVVVEAANNACIIRNPLLAVQKGSRAAVADLKVSTCLDISKRIWIGWLIDERES
jgi:hypothetical protein